MLRTRIFLRLIPFALILIAVVAYALFLSSRLAKQVESTYAESRRNEQSLHEMTSFLEGMDKEIAQYVKAEIGDKNASRLVFDDNSRFFAERLQRQLTNMVGESNQRGFLQVHSNFLIFRRIGTEIISSDPNTPEARKKYDEFVLAKLPLDLSLTGKDASEQRANNTFEVIVNTIRNISQQITSWLILGLVIALLMLAYASFKLGKAILQPIQILTKAAREIGEGKLDLTVPVDSQDELGELATTFNKMAAQLKDYRQGMNEQMVRLYHTMEAALASFSDPVFTLDTSGRVTMKNRAARELSAHLAVDAALPPRLADAVDHVLRDNRDFVPDSFSEVLTLRTAAEEKSFLPRIHLMRDPSGKPVGAVVVLHDVTRFRLLDDAKTNLVATVSHELKTPLTSVRMVLHLLLEKSLGPLTGRQNELIQTARRDSERLLNILDELLNIARLESGASSLTREPVRPADLVRDIAEEARRIAIPHGLKVTTELQGGLPAVAVNRHLIDQVFHNFISNALKHSPSGGCISITAVADDDNTGVQFAVRDEGPGIAEEFQRRIFDRFYRVPGQTKTGEGLGLSIAREIVVAHGGRVGVRSQLGIGSEFYFVLEAVDDEPARKNGRGGEIRTPDLLYPKQAR